MEYFKIVISFVAGALITLLFSKVFKLKTKGIVRLLLNSLAGSLALVIMSLCNVAYLPLNPLTALITGVFGAPGLVLVYVITAFL